MAGPAAKDVIANRYRLIHELGKGGMGTVWRAHDDRLNRSVAVKLMAKRLLADKIDVERFEREAKAVARLLSPNIVQIYDYGVDPQPFMVMELLQGENLSQRLSREGQLPLDEVATIMKESGRGLATAHEAGIVHRDLKPGNLFIVRDRDIEYVKVVDFGIAKAVRRQVTLTAITTHNQPVGTPQYMSPNQLRAKEDHRDDIWALAVIAYKALCGSHPFASESLVELVQRIMDEPHVPPSYHEPALPPELDRVFDRAFDKDRERRFQSAPEFALALEALITAAPIPVAVPEIAEALGSTEPMRVEEPVHVSFEEIPAVGEDDEDSTTEVTLVRTSRPAPAPTQPLDPTLVDPSIAHAGDPALHAISPSTPTPPPAAGTPWPVAPVGRPRAAVGAIVVGVALSMVTVVIAAWLLFPTRQASGDTSANQPAEVVETKPTPARAPEKTPEPAPVVEPAAHPSPSASTTSRPVPRPRPEPVRSPPAPPLVLPSPVPAPTPSPQPRKSGDELFNDGPF